MHCKFFVLLELESCIIEYIRAAAAAAAITDAAVELGGRERWGWYLFFVSSELVSRSDTPLSGLSEFKTPVKYKNMSHHHNYYSFGENILAMWIEVVCSQIISGRLIRAEMTLLFICRSVLR